MRVMHYWCIYLRKSALCQKVLVVICGMIIKGKSPLPPSGRGVFLSYRKRIEKGSNMETKALKKQLGAAIAMVIVAAIALGAATFAWFVNNTKVTADDANVTAKAANTLLISHGVDNQWGTTAQFKSTDTKTFVPVSTVDASNFFKDSKWTTEASGYNASEFTAASSDGASPDFYADTFKVKASQACGLYLDNETKITTAGNADVLKSMRLALVVDGKAYFYQVDAAPIAGLDDSYNTTLVDLDANGVKKAISGTNTSAAIGTANMSSGSVISLADGEVAAPRDNTTLVEADNGKKLCDLAANDEKEVKVYIWMEGCDYDCNSAVVKNITEQTVSASLGFCAGKTA